MFHQSFMSFHTPETKHDKYFGTWGVIFFIVPNSKKQDSLGVFLTINSKLQFINAQTIWT